VKAGERVDAVREEQAPSAQDEDVRQVVVQGDGPGQAGEIRKRSVRAQRQRQQHAAHGQEVEPSAAKNSHHQQAQKALIPGWSGSIAMI
jgi:hypothetical protein